MIEVLYDIKQKEWFHRAKNPITLGKNKRNIPRRNKISPISFQLNTKENKAGPVIGILAGEGKKSFQGNEELFIEISNALQQIGGMAFVFTPSTLQENSITGYLYIHKLNKWMYCHAPMPDVIYNRIPYRANEQKASFDHVKKWANVHSISFFNCCFFNKMELDKIFRDNDFLCNHLPETSPLNGKACIVPMLEKHKKVYLKPARGNQGIGFLLIKLTENHTYVVQTQKETMEFPVFEACWEFIQHYCMNRDYIIQQGIHLQTYNENPFDFRVLAHNINNVWRVSGIGVRVSSPTGITTHIPQGGTLLEEQYVSPPLDYELIDLIIKETGKELERKYGAVKQFSLDIGRTENMSYYIFEANAKPMKFDEVEIRKKGIDHLLNIFFVEAGFDI